jgi:hypothetical protein
MIQIEESEAEASGTPDFNEFDEFEEFDEEINARTDRPELSEVHFDGACTNEERAYQVALQVGLTHDLESDEIELVHEIFLENGWSQCRIAIEKELIKGTTIEELMLAKELKSLWDNRLDFAIGFNRNKKDKSDYTYSAGRVLSWVMALDIVRLLPPGSDFSELEFFLECEFEAWFGSAEKRAGCQSFSKYLYYLANEKDMEDYLWPGITGICDRDSWQLEDTTEDWERCSSTRYQLSRIGVNPYPSIVSFDTVTFTADPQVMNDY